VIGLIKVHYTYTYEGRKMQQLARNICMKKNHERSWQDLDKNFRQSWQDFGKYGKIE
jgi:hypothetical protein